MVNSLLNLRGLAERLDNPLAWRGALLVLLFLRLGMWLLFQHDIPPVLDHYNWYFHHGGDHALFVKIARQLLAGTYEPTTVGVGLPLMLAGLLKFMATVEYDRILPLVVIGNGLFLGVLSVPVIASLALALTGNRLQALVAGALWTLLPYLLWIGFGLHPQAEVLRNAYVPRQMWLTGITDGPSLFFTLLGMLLAVRGTQSVKRGKLLQVALLIAGGAALGFGVAIRIHVLPVAAVVVAALLWSRRWESAFWVVVGLLVGFAPQFWHNAVANGHPLNTPYLNGWLRFKPDGGVDFNSRGTPFAPQFLLTNLLGLARRLPLLALGGLGLALVSIYAFIRCWRLRGSAAAIILFGAPLASFALHVVTFIFIDDPVRFTLPAVSLGLPAFVWTGSIGIETIYREGAKRAKFFFNLFASLR